MKPKKPHGNTLYHRDLIQSCAKAIAAGEKTRQQLAQELGISQSYLSQLFSRHGVLESVRGVTMAGKTGGSPGFKRNKDLDAEYAAAVSEVLDATEKITMVEVARRHSNLNLSTLAYKVAAERKARAKAAAGPAIVFPN